MHVLKDKVYQLLQTVPRGKVTTYKALAQAVGSKAYRRIGQILKVNPDAPRVPCHRVVASDGTIGGFMGSRTGPKIEKKMQLLKKEGIQIRGRKIVGFNEVCITRFK